MSMYILVAFIYWLIAFLLERYQEFLENKLALV
ncbi:amino-acid ABC transporter permease yckA [Streptococcus dysgalactiae subsp. equisimilis]|nr:amino-acid ABC transporter permease yckA [Streptococcus dysgalactiae subsp. equisimilis]